MAIGLGNSVDDSRSVAGIRSRQQSFHHLSVAGNDGAVER